MFGGELHTTKAEQSSPAPAKTDRTEIVRFALEEVVRPLAIAGLMACLAVSLGQVARTYTNTPLGAFWVWLALIVSFEGIHSSRLLHRMGPGMQDRFRFRFVEWVVILLAVRFGLYLFWGAERLSADLNRWAANVTTFFDIDLILNGLLAFCFWGAAAYLARALQELEAAPFERMPAITDPGHYLRDTMPHRGQVDRQAILNRITALILSGGMVMLILSGLAQVDVSDLLLLRHSRSSGILLNVFIYFIIGFFLISQAHYVALKANWEIQDLPILGKLGRRWVVWLILFLLLVGFIAALLPVNYSVSLLDILYTAVHWIAFIAAQIIFIILWLISALMMLVMNLLRPEESTPQPAFVPPTPPPMPAGAAGGGWAWWPFVRSLLFWFVLMGIIGYSIVHFARDRWGIWRDLSFGKWLLRLFGLLRGLVEGTRRASQTLRRHLRLRFTRPSPPAPQAPWRYFSLRRLSPRDRVRYFYLSTAERASRQGLARPPASTPLEYEGLLRRELPEATGEIHELTIAFIEARYTAHPIVEEHVNWVQQVWRRLRQMLTNRKKARQQARVK